MSAPSSNNDSPRVQSREVRPAATAVSARPQPVAFDIGGVRVAAIFLICLQHVAQYLNDFFGVAMPLVNLRWLTCAGLCTFFILSGMSLKMMYRPVRTFREYLDFLQQHCLRYALPFVALNAAALLAVGTLPSLFGRLEPDFEPWHVLTRPGHTPALSLWYVEMLFEICIVWPLLAKLLASVKRKTLFLLIAYGVVYSVPFPDYFMLRRFGGYLPIFLVGCVYGIGSRSKVFPRTAVALLLWILSSAYLMSIGAPSSPWERNLSMTPVTAVAYEVSRLAGAYALIGLAGVAAGKMASLRRIINTMGFATLDIYLLHTPFVACPIAAGIAAAHCRGVLLWLAVAVGSAATVAGCVGLGRLLRRSPWTAYTFLGVGKPPGTPQSWNATVSEAVS